MTEDLVAKIENKVYNGYVRCTKVHLLRQICDFLLNETIIETLEYRKLPVFRELQIRDDFLQSVATGDEN